MSDKAAPRPQEPDDEVRELRTRLASYDRDLAGSPEAAARARAAAEKAGDLSMLVNGVALDLGAAALLAYRPVESPDIVDCCKTGPTETTQYVNVPKSSIFRVHPRRGSLSAGLIGPFTGPPPAGVFAVAQTTHASAPTVRFHASVWTRDCDPGAVGALLKELEEPLAFLPVEPGRKGYLVSMAGPQQGSHASAPDTASPWGILLATMAEPPEKIEFAWADFSTICLIHAAAEGSEIAVLI